MSAIQVGSLVALLGAVALVGTLAVWRALRDVALEREHLVDREEQLDRREKALDEYARSVHEWEGRLMQVAACGCDPHTLDEPTEGRVRPGRTPPRGPRPGRPPTRRG